MPDPLGKGVARHELGGKNMGELQRIGGDGRLGKLLAFGGNRVLQAAAQPATNLRRKSGEEGLV